MPISYCIVCKGESIGVCGDCRISSYCSVECQRHDYRFVHKHECHLHKTSGCVTSLGKEQSEGSDTLVERRRGVDIIEQKQKPGNAIKATKDIDRKTELNALLVAINEAIERMRSEDTPHSQKRLHLEQMSGVDRARFTRSIEQSLTVSRLEYITNDIHHKFYYMRELNTMASLAAKMKKPDGTVREVAEVKDSPELLRRMAKYYRMKEIMIAKLKLAFLTADAGDVDESVKWQRLVERYNEKMIYKWLFSDDIAFAVLENGKKEMEKKMLDAQFRENIWESVHSQTLDIYMNYLQNTKDDDDEDTLDLGAKEKPPKKLKTPKTNEAQGDDAALPSIIRNVERASKKEYETMIQANFDVSTSYINRLVPITQEWVDANIISEEVRGNIMERWQSLKNWFQDQTGKLDNTDEEGGEPNELQLNYIEWIDDRWEKFKKRLKDKYFNWKVIRYVSSLVFMCVVIIAVAGYASDYISAAPKAQAIHEQVEMLKTTLAGASLPQANKIEKNLKGVTTQLRDVLQFFKGTERITLDTIRPNEYGNVTSQQALGTEITAVLRRFKTVIEQPGSNPVATAQMSAFARDYLTPFVSDDVDLETKRSLLAYIQSYLGTWNAALYDKNTSVAYVEGLIKQTQLLVDQTVFTTQYLTKSLRESSELAQKLVGDDIPALIANIKRTEISAPATLAAAKFFGVESLVDTGTSELLINGMMKNEWVPWFSAYGGTYLKQAAQLEYRFRNLIRESALHIKNNSYIMGAMGLLYEWTLGPYDAIVSSYFIFTSMSHISSVISKTYGAAEWLVGWIPGDILDTLWEMIKRPFYGSSAEAKTAEDETAQYYYKRISNTQTNNKQKIEDLEVIRRDGESALTYRVYFKVIQLIHHGVQGSNIELRTSLGEARFRWINRQENAIQPVIDAVYYWYYVKNTFRIANFFYSVYLLVTTFVSSWCLGGLSLIYVLYIVQRSLQKGGGICGIFSSALAPFWHLSQFYARHPFMTDTLLGLTGSALFLFYPGTAIGQKEWLAVSFGTTNTTTTTGISSPSKTDDTSWTSSFFLSPTTPKVDEDVTYIQRAYEDIAKNATGVTSDLADVESYQNTMYSFISNIRLLAKNGEDLKLEPIAEMGFIAANVTPVHI